jgi:hypothetical protein
MIVRPNGSQGLPATSTEFGRSAAAGIIDANSIADATNVMVRIARI